MVRIEFLHDPNNLCSQLTFTTWKDAKDLMAPPIDKDKLKASLKNPWQAEMLEKDIELLKIAKKQKAEEE